MTSECHLVDDIHRIRSESRSISVVHFPNESLRWTRKCVIFHAVLYISNVLGNILFFSQNCAEILASLFISWEAAAIPTKVRNNGFSSVVLSDVLAIFCAHSKVISWRVWIFFSSTTTRLLFMIIAHFIRPLTIPKISCVHFRVETQRNEKSARNRAWIQNNNKNGTKNKENLHKPQWFLCLLLNVWSTTSHAMHFYFIYAKQLPNQMKHRKTETNWLSRLKCMFHNANRVDKQTRHCLNLTDEINTYVCLALAMRILRLWKMWCHFSFAKRWQNLIFRQTTKGFSFWKEWARMAWWKKQDRNDRNREHMLIRVHISTINKQLSSNSNTPLQWCIVYIIQMNGATRCRSVREWTILRIYGIISRYKSCSNIRHDPLYVTITAATDK